MKHSKNNLVAGGFLFLTASIPAGFLSDLCFRSGYYILSGVLALWCGIFIVLSSLGFWQAAKHDV